MYTYMYVYISTCVFAIMYVHVSVHVCGAHLVDDTRLAAVCFRRHEWFLHRKRYVVSVGRLPVLRRRREQRCVHEGRHMHVKGGTCMEREAHACKVRHMHGKEGTCMEREAHAGRSTHGISMWIEPHLCHAGFFPQRTSTSHACIQATGIRCICTYIHRHRPFSPHRNVLIAGQINTIEVVCRVRVMQICTCT